MSDGTVGPIGAILLFLFFIANWFIWLGKWIAQVGAEAVTTNSMTGIEGFMFGNLNLVVMIACILGMAGYFYVTRAV